MANDAVIGSQDIVQKTKTADAQSISAESKDSIRTSFEKTQVDPTQDPKSIIFDGNEITNFQKKSPELYKKFIEMFAQQQCWNQGHYDKHRLERQKKNREESERH